VIGRSTRKRLTPDDSTATVPRRDAAPRHRGRAELRVPSRGRITRRRCVSGEHPMPRQPGNRRQAQHRPRLRTASGVVRSHAERSTQSDDRGAVAERRPTFVLPAPSRRVRQTSSTVGDAPRLLAVLFLPNDPASWLRHSDEELALCRCAYWVSLLGAPASNNETGQTIYLPEQQALSPDGLLGLFERVAHREELRYETGGPRAKQDRTGRGRTS
jgi:hypothetical protein